MNHAEFGKSLLGLTAVVGVVFNDIKPTMLERETAFFTESHYSTKS